MKKGKLVENLLFEFKHILRFSIPILIGISLIIIIAIGSVVYKNWDYFSNGGSIFNIGAIQYCGAIICFTIVILYLYKILDKKYPDVKIRKIGNQDYSKKKKWYDF